MTAINSPFAQNLKTEFTEFFDANRLKNLKNCILHCNLQIKNEQRSWAKIVYDHKITIITLVASSVITRFALNSLLSMSMVALPLVAVPLIYATYKFSSLQDEASDRLVETQKVFFNVFSKYGGEEYSSGKYQAVDFFRKNFTDSPRKHSSLKEKELVDIITRHGDDKGLGSLVKIVFSQVVKDQSYLDKISDYQTTFQIGSAAILVTAQNIDQFLGPYSFLASKSFLITSVLFTTGAIGGCATYNYIKHWNDHKIGKETFKENLYHLNKSLEIPQEHRAYV